MSQPVIIGYPKLELQEVYNSPLSRYNYLRIEWRRCAGSW